MNKVQAGGRSENIEIKVQLNIREIIESNGTKWFGCVKDVGWTNVWEDARNDEGAYTCW